MDRRRIGLLALLWLSISLLAGAGIPPAKQGVTRVKEANAAVKPFNEKEAGGILQELARNYKGPRGALAPSAMLQWARSARPLFGVTLRGQAYTFHIVAEVGEARYKYGGPRS